VVVEVKASSLNFPRRAARAGALPGEAALPFSPGMELAGSSRRSARACATWKPGESGHRFPGPGRIRPGVPRPGRARGPAARRDGLRDGLGVQCSPTARRCTRCRTAAPAAGRDGGRAGRRRRRRHLGHRDRQGDGARVVAAASSEEKLAFCRQLGADETIDYQTADLRQRILDFDGRKGADVVYDPVGGAHTEAALRATAWRGRLLVIGICLGRHPAGEAKSGAPQERSLIGRLLGRLGAARSRRPAPQRRASRRLVHARKDPACG